MTDAIITPDVTQHTYMDHLSSQSSPLARERVTVSCLYHIKEKSETYFDLVTQRSDEHARSLSFPRAFVSLIPCITYTHSKLRSVTIERYGRHGRVVLRILAQAFLQFVVPDRDSAV